MNHYVYEITNNLNKKKYIGKRSTHLAIEKDNYWGSGIAIKQAIKKYGKENFSKTILHICTSEKDAYNQEELEIERVKAYDSPLYYNIAKGGLGVHYGSAKPKKRKSVPPDFKYRPPIFNPNEYIESVKNDFENADGYALFKLKYFCGYLILKGEDKSITIQTLLESTKQYYVAHSFTEHKWRDIIENVYLDVSIIPEEQLIKIYQTREVVIYKSEMEQIMILPSIFLKKSALTFLITYKFFYEDDVYVERHDNWLKKIYGSLSNRKQKAVNELLKYGCIKLKNNHFTVPFAKFSGDDMLEILTAYSPQSLLLIDLYNGQNIVKCEKCGQLMFDNKSRTKKYCGRCRNYKPIGLQKKMCISCGEIFVANSKSRAKRCSSCQKNERKRIYRECKRKQRQNKSI